MKTENELIAEFMGGKHRKIYGPLTGEEYTEVKLTGNANWQIAHYATSWDWLMPVVEKIGKMYDPHKYKAYEEREPVWDIVDLTIMNPINEVYGSVVEFIKWHNIQSK